MKKKIKIGILVLPIIVIIIVLVVSIFIEKKDGDTPQIFLPEAIDASLLQELFATNKIIVRDRRTEDNDNVMTTITDMEEIQLILSLFPRATMQGETFTCDGSNLALDMYDSEDRLIDTINIWFNGRMMPRSLAAGCSYFMMDVSIIMNIIEIHTENKFFIVYDNSEVCDDALELIFEDDSNFYYFTCIKSDKVIIEFVTTGRKMTVKEALNENFISIDELMKKQPDLLYKVSK